MVEKINKVMYRTRYGRDFLTMEEAEQSEFFCDLQDCLMRCNFIEPEYKEDVAMFLIEHKENLIEILQKIKIAQHQYLGIPRS